MWTSYFCQANFVVSLANELRNTERSEICRQQAALQLKNALSSKEEAVADEKSQQWRRLDPNLTAHVKQSVRHPLFHLRSSLCRFLRLLARRQLRRAPLRRCGPPHYGTLTLQVIAAIATIEVPENLWPGVMDQLSTPLRSPGTPEPLRVACLETIGYICDALVPASSC